MAVTTNPTIDFKNQQPSLYYFNDGACFGGCVGSPEGVVTAAYGSLLIDVNTGNGYLKQSASGNTGWMLLATGGGTVPGGSNKQVQFNNSGSFGGAAGFEYQSGATPNVLITAQNAAYQALRVVQAATPSAAVATFVDNPGTGYVSIDPSETITSAVQINTPDGVANLYHYYLVLSSAGSNGALIDLNANVGYSTIVQQPSGVANTALSNVPNSLFIQAAPGNNGGLILNARENAPIIFATEGQAFTNEKGRFDANGLTLGRASSVTGSLVMAVSGSANTQTFRAADTPAASNIFKWPSANPTGGQALTASAPSGGIVTLSWTSLVTGSVGSAQVPYGDGAGGLTSEAAFTYTAASNSLQISGVGSNFILQDGSSPATSTTLTLGNIAAQVSSTSSNPSLQLKRIRGSSDYPDSGDTLANFDILSSDGATNLTPFRITVVATQNHTASLAGSSFTLSLAPNGTTTRTDRITINGSGEANMRGLWAFRNGAAITPVAPVHVRCNVTSNEGVRVEDNGGTVIGDWYSDGTAMYFGPTSGHELNLLGGGSALVRLGAGGTTLGFFGVSPVARPTMGTATAGAVYTATEQAMLQAVYNAVRTLGLGT